MDASPQKLFYALKEMSVSADKYDDILADEFDELENNLSGKITQLTEEVLQTKEDFLRSQLNQSLSAIHTLKGDDEASQALISYHLLYTNYKLDYLIKPEGFMMEIFERNHREYFENSKQTALQKYKEIEANFQLILDRDSDHLREEFYQTCHTFDYTKPASHLDLKALIEKELPKAQQYYVSKKQDIAGIVCGYIASYSLFHYSLPAPDLDLLHLLMRVLEDPYFLSLGYTPAYVEEGMPQQAIIEKKIESIKEEHLPTHPYLKINFGKLVYRDLSSFAISFLTMVASIDIHYHKQLM